MKKVKNILIGLLVFSIIALCFIFNGPLVTEASSDDENSRPYTQLKNTTSDPETKMCIRDSFGTTDYSKHFR